MRYSAAAASRRGTDGRGRRRACAPRARRTPAPRARARAAGLRVAVDVGEELRRGEFALDHVAFELGHVDAVGGEAAERLVERRRHVAHAKDESRHHRPVAARRAHCGVFDEHDEARRVVRLVLDVGGERRRGRRSRRRARSRARRGSGRAHSATSRAEPAVSPATTGFRPSWRMILRHWPSAWTWLWTAAQVFERRAGHGEQLEMDRQEGLGDDVQAGGRQQRMDVGDPAGDRVLDRDHRQIGRAVLQRRERVLESGAGQAAGRSGKSSRQAMCELAPGSP